ncbi:MAG: EndoU domain-containing protein [Roseburia inulinivorans]
MDIIIKGIEGTSGNVIPETESSTNNFGIYKAKVEVNGIPKTANGGFSSFYPKSMSPQEVIGSINEAYRNRAYIRGNTYSGLTSSGMEIEMFLDKNGKIISAYPVY